MVDIFTNKIDRRKIKQTGIKNLVGYTIQEKDRERDKVWKLDSIPIEQSDNGLLFLLFT